MKEQSSQGRLDHRNVCERIERDEPTRMGEGGSRRDPVVFRYPRDGGPPSERRERDGYAASETEGSLECFSNGRFLKVVFCAACTSTSTGALRRLPRGIQGSFQVFLDSDELKDSQKACRFQATWSHTLNSTRQPENWKRQRPSQQKTSRRGKFRDRQ